MECFKKHGFENQGFCMKGGVDGLMPDSAPPTAGKRRRINPPQRYKYISICVYTYGVL